MPTNSNLPNKHNIICRWMEENKFLVNPDQQVWPCCYLANQGYKFRQTGQYKDKDILERKVDDIASPVMQEYYKHEDELNLKNNSLEEILNHEWYTKTLPESWDSDNPQRVCVIMCSRFMDED